MREFRFIGCTKWKRNEVKFINKTELAKLISNKNAVSAKAGKEALDMVLDAIAEGLEKGEDISLPGFGTFTVRERAAREGKNPRTGEKITIAASKIVGFKTGKTLKNKVNGAKN